MNRPERREHPRREEKHRALHQGARVNRGEKRKKEEGAPHACPPFMERGSALRSAPFLAPPPFWKLPKKGRSSLPTASHRASTNRGRAAPPRLRHTPRRKQAGKIRAPLGTPLVSFRVRETLVVCVEVGCVLGVAVWMAWLLRYGCGDVGCSKIQFPYNANVYRRASCRFSVKSGVVPRVLRAGRSSAY